MSEWLKFSSPILKTLGGYKLLTGLGNESTKWSFDTGWS